MEIERFIYARVIRRDNERLAIHHESNVANKPFIQYRKNSFAIVLAAIGQALHFRAPGGSELAHASSVCPQRPSPQGPIWPNARCPVGAFLVAVFRPASTQGATSIASAAAAPLQITEVIVHGLQCLRWPHVSAAPYARRESRCRSRPEGGIRLCCPTDDRRCRLPPCPNHPQRPPTPQHFRRGRRSTPRLLHPQPQNFPLPAAAVRPRAIP